MHGGSNLFESRSLRRYASFLYQADDRRDNMQMDPHIGTTPEPFQAGLVVNLHDGEERQQPTLLTVPPGKWLVIECIGINAFAQRGQIFVIALEVTTSGHPGIYPIVLPGSSTIAEPLFPARSFGSQLVRLYAAPTTPVLLPITRTPAQGAARVDVSISGVLVEHLLSHPA
jgi:hypothetical protein